MKIKLKVGVIGLGHQAIEDHIPAIKNSKDVELIGVVDSNKEVLDNFSIENPGINVFNNLEKMIKKNKPDFVIISLPHNCHYENTKLALENKIHVLKEKPFMVSLKQAKKINEIAKKNNLKVGDNFLKYNENYMSSVIKNIFKKVYDADITLNYIRRSHATYINNLNISNNERNKLILEMGHSPNESLLYRKII